MGLAFNNNLPVMEVEELSSIDMSLFKAFQERTSNNSQILQNESVSACRMDRYAVSELTDSIEQRKEMVKDIDISKIKFSSYKPF